MKKFVVFSVLVAACIGAMLISFRPTENTAVTIDDNGAREGSYGSIDEPTPIKDPSQGIQIAPNDDPGTGPNANVSLSTEENGPWLPPEDFLTEEDREILDLMAHAAGLVEEEPDYREKLAEFYKEISSTTRSSELPDYETYQLCLKVLERRSVYASSIE